MQWNELQWAYSTCPNDTFIFYALANQKLVYGAIQPPHLCDIAELNTFARRGDYDIIKISAALYPEIATEYQILSVGGAFGVGVGPIFVKVRGKELPESESQWDVLVPGYTTTANLLLSLFHPKIQRRTEVLFSEIGAKLLADSHYAAGVLIHEGRFTYETDGLELVEDFGERWYRQYKCPLPLGLICVRRSLPSRLKKQICTSIAESIAYARKHYTEAEQYMRRYAQEMTSEVMRAHVEYYVNALSEDMDTTGKAALAALYSSKDVVLDIV